MTQDHLTLRNSPIVNDLVAEIREDWREATDGWGPWHLLHTDILDELRWSTAMSSLVRHAPTGILFLINWRSGHGDFGENELGDITPVVAKPRTITVYDLEDAEGGSIRERLIIDADMAVSV